MYLLIDLVNLAFSVAYWLIFIRVILSWFRPNIRDPRVYKLIRLLYDLTEPMLGPIRQFMPKEIGLDFSPLIALFLLRLIQGLVIDIMRMMI